MTEGVAQDGKASSVLQDMGKVLLGHIHRKWLFGRSVPASLRVKNSNRARLPFHAVPGKVARGTRGCSRIEMLWAGGLLHLDVGRTVEESGNITT